jgi:S-adenosylmethionine:tRNA ribosyltransferase-isomerase
MSHRETPERAPGEALPGGAVPTGEYDYPLPSDRIAQEPAPARDSARLLALGREHGAIRHARFTDLPDLLHPGDLLVLNDTRVIRARLTGRKPTGGRVEFLLIAPVPGPGRWEALSDATRELREGLEVSFGETIRARVVGREGDRVLLEFPGALEVLRFLEQHGEVPLPPYIRREEGPREADAERYQTVYALHPGSVAAPTAGLHFTPDLFGRLERRGIRRVFLTLHVGLGTFLPVREPDARRHRLPPERFRVSAAAAAEIRDVRAGGRRVVAVGTTTTRVLEHLAATGGIREAEGVCDLFVLPGHRFRGVDALVTNFHLPRSTLLMLVCAFAGKDRVLRAYAEAVERGYRFYSYGDAMLIA